MGVCGFYRECVAYGNEAGLRDLIVFVIMDNSCEFCKGCEEEWSGSTAAKFMQVDLLDTFALPKPCTISPPGWQTFRPILK